MADPACHDLAASALLIRHYRQITRSKGANIARAMSNIFSAIVFGFFYFQLGNGQASVQVGGTMATRYPSLAPPVPGYPSGRSSSSEAADCMSRGRRRR